MTQQFKEGDLVEATKGEEVRRGRVSTWLEGGLYLAHTPLSIYQREEWTLTLIEAAKPADILPKEAGVYADKDGCPRRFYGGPYSSKGLEKYAPFTRLEPVPVTAKKIIDRIDVMRARGETTTLYQVQKVIAAEFGVES